MGTTAERNRKLKAVLVAEFGRENVVVRGAHGWVQVRVRVPDLGGQIPRLRARVWELVKEHGIEIGTYGYDAPGSDYGSELSLDEVDAADAQGWVTFTRISIRRRRAEKWT